MAGVRVAVARRNTLKQARMVLFFVGGLTILVQGFLFYQADDEVREEFDKQVAKLRAKNIEIDNAKWAELTTATVRTTRLLYGGFALLGVIFIVFGLTISLAPLPITIAALVIYLGGQGISAMLEPATIIQGLLIKILVIAALVAGVRAAFAAERERRSALEAEPAA